MEEGQRLTGLDAGGDHLAEGFAGIERVGLHVFDDHWFTPGESAPAAVGAARHDLEEPQELGPEAAVYAEAQGAGPWLNELQVAHVGLARDHYGIENRTEELFERRDGRGGICAGGVQQGLECAMEALDARGFAGFDRLRDGVARACVSIGGVAAFEGGLGV
jgi:hypothetical protein